MHALVVDDSRTMRSILSRTLHNVGAEVDEAPDGAAAMERLERGPLPDLVLVDWNMPVMNGLEFVVAARGRPEWRAVTIMMVSTEAEYGQVARALVAGANEYLIKPFTPDALLEKLELLGLATSPEAATGGQPTTTDSAGGFSAS